MPTTCSLQLKKRTSSRVANTTTTSKQPDKVLQRGQGRTRRGGSGRGAKSLISRNNPLESNQTDATNDSSSESEDSNDSGQSHQERTTKSTTARMQHDDDDDSDAPGSDEIGFTLENFESKLSSWSATEL
ncbi:hypothetical protein PCASD_02149 [Puccinia coronata f. sp. avenae]|uniref:Uncharacterized protein n=1 Tax=Puccinia coronata f. sp. avenae TaxID=200324 RepID=A0A2N5VPX0_9BASI|nr:hypothetical protein PCASD_02149 [Puccinia coronata f. sp. avenae]